MDKEVELFDEHTRLRMANQVMEQFGLWHVPLDAQLVLLALPDTIKKRHLYKFGEDEPLPDDVNVMERAEHILGIADALRTYFPNSAHARSQFIRSNSKKFPKATPLQIMINDGGDD